MGSPWGFTSVDGWPQWTRRSLPPRRLDPHFTGWCKPPRTEGTFAVGRWPCRKDEGPRGMRSRPDGPSTANRGARGRGADNTLQAGACTEANGCCVANCSRSEQIKMCRGAWRAQVERVTLDPGAVSSSRTLGVGCTLKQTSKHKPTTYTLLSYRFCG